MERMKIHLDLQDGMEATQCVLNDSWFSPHIQKFCFYMESGIVLLQGILITLWLATVTNHNMWNGSHTKEVHVLHRDKVKKKCS